MKGKFSPMLPTKRKKTVGNCSSNSAREIPPTLSAEVHYTIGYYGRNTRLTRWALSRLKLTERHLDEIRALWAEHPGKTMFLGKLSYGIASAFIIIAGVVRMPFQKFLVNGIWVTVVQYGGLLFVGYYFGQSLGGDIVQMVDDIQYVLAGVILAAPAYYLFGWYARHKLEDEDKTVTGE